MSVHVLRDRSDRCPPDYEARLRFWRDEAQLSVHVGGHALELAMRFVAFYEARIADLRQRSEQTG
jgi:hypothetical protein